MTNTTTRNDRPYQIPFLARNVKCVLQCRQHRLRQLPNRIAIKYPWYFHTMVEKNGQRVMSMQPLENISCPICGHSTLADHEDVWIHCYSAHGCTYSFEAAQTKDGKYHLLAKKSDTSSENQFLELSRFLETSKIIYWRDAPENADVAVGDNRIPSWKHSIRRGVSLPLRDYFHNLTFEKIRLTEWLFAEDELIDEEWQKTVEGSMLCEYTDVTDNEKRFFWCWNAFMKAHPILAKTSLPRQCYEFVEHYAETILRHHLDKQLICHLTNLWYEGDIGRSHILACMDYYNEFVSKNDSQI